VLARGAGVSLSVALSIDRWMKSLWQVVQVWVGGIPSIVSRCTREIKAAVLHCFERLIVERGIGDDLLEIAVFLSAPYQLPG
jgi:hypothetical protein